jgi:hypothetical protein
MDRLAVMLLREETVDQDEGPRPEPTMEVSHNGRDSTSRAWQRANAVRPATRTYQADPVTPMMEEKNGHEYQHTALGPW